MMIACIIVGTLGLAFGLACGYRLYRWERQLSGARIAIFYKNKVSLNQPLIDWLDWCNRLDRDQQAKGRPVYKMGGTTVAILKRKPPTKTKTTTRKGGNDGTGGKIHRMVQSRRKTGARTGSYTARNDHELGGKKSRA